MYLPQLALGGHAWPLGVNILDGNDGFDHPLQLSVCAVGHVLLARLAVDNGIDILFAQVLLLSQAP